MARVVHMRRLLRRHGLTSLLLGVGAAGARRCARPARRSEREARRSRPRS